MSLPSIGWQQSIFISEIMMMLTLFRRSRKACKVAERPRIICRLKYVTVINIIDAHLRGPSLMHPPKFLPDHRLSDWPECVLEIRCRICGGRSASCAVKGLIRWYGDRTFAEVLARLRCKYCRKKPAPVYLCASPHRRPSRFNRTRILWYP